VAGGLDMSFWIWVGVAIVVVLVVAFVREQARAASRGATREVTLKVASKGETLSATRTRASSGRRQRWRVTRRPCPALRPPSASRDWVVNLSINLRGRWEYLSVRERFGWCRQFGKFNDNWVGTNWTES
jgi:hypothetical protein